MSSTNKTEHLQLNQWVGTDPFRMADFNEDNAKLDAALKANADAIANTTQALAAVQSSALKIATGSYTGTGTYGKNNKNSLNFDFAPKLIVIAKQQALYQEDYMAIVAGQENAHCFGITDGDGRCHLLWSDDGKTVSWYNSQNVYAQMNVSGNIYCYSAIG